MSYFLKTHPLMNFTWLEVIEKLLSNGVLLEDSSTGIIQIHPQYYQQLGKVVPGTLSIQHHKRAEALTIKYLELWPKKILSGGRPVRQGPSGISKKLGVFIKNNPKFTDEQILEATTRYVKTKAGENWSYATCSDYFIYKNSVSMLETYLVDPELGIKTTEKIPIQLNQKFI